MWGIKLCVMAVMEQANKISVWLLCFGCSFQEKKCLWYRYYLFWLAQRVWLASCDKRLGEVGFHNKYWVKGRGAWISGVETLRLIVGSSSPPKTKVCVFVYVYKFPYAHSHKCSTGGARLLGLCWWSEWGFVLCSSVQNSQYGSYLCGLKSYTPNLDKTF